MQNHIQSFVECQVCLWWLYLISLVGYLSKDMISRYIQLLSFPSNVICAEGKLFTSENHTMQEVLKILKGIDATKNILRNKSVNFCDIRRCLDAKMKTFPSSRCTARTTAKVLNT